MRSLDLRKEPSVRQSETILRRIDEELTARGARVERAGAVGGLRFRMPRPWHAPRLGILLVITTGRAVVSAGSGGPWRVRYELDFSALRWVTILLTAALIVAGYRWDRLVLLNAIGALWVVAYGIPYVAASIRFARIIRASASEILERRYRARASPEEPGTDESGSTPPPEGRPVEEPAEGSATGKPASPSPEDTQRPVTEGPQAVRPDAGTSHAPGGEPRLDDSDDQRPD